jgi:hypothetical protein
LRWLPILGLPRRIHIRNAAYPDTAQANQRIAFPLAAIRLPTKVFRMHQERDNGNIILFATMAFSPPMLRSAIFRYKIIEPDNDNTDLDPVHRLPSIIFVMSLRTKDGQCLAGLDSRLEKYA